MTLRTPIVAVLLAVVCAAQPRLPTLTHSTWTGRDGAPQGTYALAQTTDGHLWLATLSGLYRFDGLRFSPVLPSPAGAQFPSLDINVLAPDTNHGLWMGFHVGGLGYLKDGRLTLYNEQSGLPMDYVAQILVQPDGRLWTVTAGRLMRLDHGRFSDFGTPLGLPEGTVQSIFFDRAGNLWAAAGKHVYVRRQGETRFAQTPEIIKTVTEFLQAPDGTIWIADGWTSVRPLLAAHPKTSSIPLQGTATVVFDTQGDLWIANDYTGLLLARHPADSATPLNVEAFTRDEGLTSNETRGLLQDREGNIWVGTGLGLDRFKHSAFRSFTQAPLKSFPSLAAAPDGTVWIGSLGNPLIAIRDGQVTQYGKKRGTGPLYRAADGAIWQFNYWAHHLWTARGDDFEAVPSPPGLDGVTVQCLTGTPAGDVYAAFEHAGIFRFRKSQWSPVSAPPGKTPLALLSAPDGTLWAGYADGLIAAVAKDKPRAYSTPGLGSVMTLYHHNGRLWAGGTNGLMVFRDEAFTRLHAVEGIALRGISGIVETAAGDLYLNGASGVVRIAAPELAHALRDPAYLLQAEIFDFRDGLSGTPAQLRPTPTAIADAHGTLWFATAANVTALQPDALPHPAPPQVSVLAIRTDGASRDFTGRTRLAIGARNLLIDYVGISLGAPQRVLYRYKLDGEDGGWQDAGVRRQALYSNLRPGAYRFHVAASLGDGRWNEYVLPLSLEVPPAFYQTTWFLAACIVTLLAALLIGHRLRVHHVTTRVRERLEERAAERVRIARDLHDTLLQGFQGLMLRIHFAAEHIPPGDPARAMMDDALDTADHVIEEGRARVRGLRSEGLNERDLAKALAQVGTDLNYTSNIRFIVTEEGTRPPLHPIIEDELYFIGREAIANAFRHAQATEIEVEINTGGKALSLCCRDNGRGIEPEVLRDGGRDGHWGLRGMRERARKIGAKLECWSTPGKGTEITLTVATNAPVSPSARN